ncbi:hypothetical protein [Corynebacterium vitaeruminis]|uniref:hypothetical protein n=1 Tax=Corynebacterium vitaeruminis TaxID=38305 RepID=UPI0023F04AD6|nr:hypothetical protein [Corynebacterium vitaeruminis]
MMKKLAAALAVTTALTLAAPAANAQSSAPTQSEPGLGPFGQFFAASSDAWQQFVFPNIAYMNTGEEGQYLPQIISSTVPVSLSSLVAVPIIGLERYLLGYQNSPFMSS